MGQFYWISLRKGLVVTKEKLNHRQCSLSVCKHLMSLLERILDTIDNKISIMRNVKRTVPSSITNQSEKSEIFPSNVVQEGKKMLAMYLPIGSESQLARYFKAFYTSDSFNFPLTLKHRKNQKLNSTMFKTHPAMSCDKTNDEIKYTTHEWTINDPRLRVHKNCEGT